MPAKSRTLSAEHKAKLAAGRREKAAAQARALAAEREHEARTIDDKIAKASGAYDVAMTKASRSTTSADIRRNFDAADRAMNTLISLIQRKRQLGQ